MNNRWIKKIDVGVYDCYVNLIVSDSIDDEYNNLIKKHFKVGELIKDKGTYYGLFVSDDDSNKNYWLLFEHKISDYHVVHECLHAAITILLDRNIRVNNDDTEEVLAYLHQYIFRQVNNFLTKKRDGKENRRG